MSSSSTASEKYATKLATKLSGLQETSSKETLQTLAKWIAFHRKHANRLIPVLMDSKTSGVLHPKKGARTAAVVSELLLLDKDRPTRWERLADLRVAVGEQLVRTIADAASSSSDAALTSATVEKLSSLLPEWDKHNVFGGPTLIHQLKRKLSSTTSTSSSSSSPEKAKAAATRTASATKKTKQAPDKPAAAAAAAEAKTKTKTAAKVEAAPIKKKDDDETMKEQSVEEIEETKKKAAVSTSEKMDIEKEEEKKPPSTAASPASPPASSTVKDTTATTSTKDTTKAPAPSQQQQQQQKYDFESKNIPERTIEPRQFLEPCRAIATLQIARDLRNDNAVQLSSLLQGMPQDVRAFTAETAEAGGTIVDLDETKARDFSMRTSDQLLDTDLTEALQNVGTLRDILIQQSAARQQLLDLLIASRCKFGADDVAASYQSIQVDEWKRRSQILADAMELEGLDIAEMEESTSSNKTPNAKENLDEELPPLAWYQPSNNDDDNEEASNKRLKVE